MLSVGYTHFDLSAALWIGWFWGKILDEAIKEAVTWELSFFLFITYLWVRIVLYQNSHPPRSSGENGVLPSVVWGL